MEQNVCETGSRCMVCKCLVGVCTCEYPGSHCVDTTLRNFVGDVNDFLSVKELPGSEVQTFGSGSDRPAGVVAPYTGGHGLCLENSSSSASGVAPRLLAKLASQMVYGEQADQQAVSLDDVDEYEKWMKTTRVTRYLEGLRELESSCVFSPKGKELMKHWQKVDSKRFCSELEKVADARKTIRKSLFMEALLYRWLTSDTEMLDGLRSLAAEWGLAPF